MERVRVDERGVLCEGLMELAEDALEGLWMMNDVELVEGTELPRRTWKHVRMEWAMDAQDYTHEGLQRNRTA